RKRSYSDSAKGKRIVRYPFLGECAPVAMPSSMCADVARDSSLTSRNRGRHSTPLQTINRIRYNQGLLTTQEATVNAPETSLSPIFDFEKKHPPKMVKAQQIVYALSELGKGRIGRT